MAEAGRGQVGGDGTAVRVPHHNQTIITTCHQGMVALQCFRSWISGGMCLLVLTEATKTDKAEGVGVLGGVRQRWWPRMIPRGTLCNKRCNFVMPDDSHGDCLQHCAVDCANKHTHVHISTVHKMMTHADVCCKQFSAGSMGFGIVLRQC